MPGVLIHNWPDGMEFKKVATGELYAQLAQVAKVPLEEVSVEVADAGFRHLTSNGQLVDSLPYVFVNWYFRSLKAKQAVANALKAFFEAHGIFNHGLTFVEYAKESFFFNGHLAPGGEPIPLAVQREFDLLRGSMVRDSHTAAAQRPM